MKVLLYPSGLFLVHFFNAPGPGFSVVLIWAVPATRHAADSVKSLPVQLCSLRYREAEKYGHSASFLKADSHTFYTSKPHHMTSAG